MAQRRIRNGEQVILKNNERGGHNLSVPYCNFAADKQRV